MEKNQKRHNKTGIIFSKVFQLKYLNSYISNIYQFSNTKKFSKKYFITQETISKILFKTFLK